MENMEASTTVWTTLDRWRAMRAAVFGKWLMVYFWLKLVLLIPAVIVVISAANETLLRIAEFMDYILSGVGVWVLYKLGRQGDRFKTCASLSLILLVAGVVIQLLGSELAAYLWAISGGILDLVITYQFMMGCAEILASTDTELSEKWRKLWKWTVGLMIGSIIGFLLLIFLMLAAKNLLAVMLSLILPLGFGIVWLVVMILQMVYLYRTASLFRGISKTIGLSHTGSLE